MADRFLLFRLFALTSLDGLFQHFDVHVDAYGVDKSGLVFTQQIASAADRQVAHRDAVAASQLGKLLYGLQTLFGCFIELAAGWRHQVGIGDAVASSDSALDLIHLGESEVLGVVDDDRIGIRDIDAVFNDRRTYEDIDFVARKLHHDIFDCFPVHTTMGDADPGIGNGDLQIAGNGCNVIDVVIEIEHLSVACQFLFNRIHDQ